ncbi:hypothetical protein GQ55_5G275800 [Panicum hallii var. hallii]|uniref:Uncharacterized protein n=1 Tax=Panicum hallii var. hallii TaxID=1504633 RepID=A0A2T7DKT8_9POAL|nr:hypothetical protein GQ55_5G275800 [Panicum hallii var. hallii]
MTALLQGCRRATEAPTTTVLLRGCRRAGKARRRRADDGGAARLPERRGDANDNDAMARLQPEGCEDNIQMTCRRRRVRPRQRGDATTSMMPAGRPEALASNSRSIHINMQACAGRASLRCAPSTSYHKQAS